MAEQIERERLQAAAALNWNEMHEALHDAEWMDEYREQRFYPLKQVVDIFSSGDPEGLTIEVRTGPVAPTMLGLPGGAFSPLNLALECGTMGL